MQIIDTTGSTKTTARAEINQPIQSFLFRSDVHIDDLTTESINIRVTRTNNGQNLQVVNEDVKLSTLLIAMSGLKIPFVGDIAYKTVALINLTLNGNIPLFDNDNITFELKNLKTANFYKLDGIKGSIDASHMNTYVKKNFPITNSVLEFKVSDYDFAVMELSDDITTVETRNSNGFLITYTYDEFLTLMRVTTPIASIDQDGVIRHSFEKHLPFPLVNIETITFKKDNPTTLTNLLLRKNLY
jgi:hypothetical protein